MFDRKVKMNPNTVNTYCLSDHDPFKINGLCFVWNILVQMKGGKFFNNGFKCILETEEQYVSRLKHIASQINSVIDEETPPFICLQETPKTDKDREEFLSLINKKYASESLTSESTQISFYNTELYSYLPELTQKIKGVGLQEGLANRVIPLVLVNNISKEATLVINVHANFQKDVQNDVKSLHEAAKNNGIHHIIFAGDFNRNLTGIQKPADDEAKKDIYEEFEKNGSFHGLHVNSIPDAACISKKDQETGVVDTIVETRDGCLTSMNVSVEHMPQLNCPSTKVLTLISDDLKNKADGFNQLKTSSYNKCLG